jgi:hypothetical protein
MPVWFLSVTLLALATGIGVWFFRQTLIWTPLQQFYLSAYTRSTLASSLGIRTGRYRVLLMESRRGNRLAIDEEVVPVTSTSGESIFALSELAHEPAVGGWSGEIRSTNTPTFTCSSGCGSMPTRR